MYAIPYDERRPTRRKRTRTVTNVKTQATHIIVTDTWVEAWIDPNTGETKRKVKNVKKLKSRNVTVHATPKGGSAAAWQQKMQNLTPEQMQARAAKARDWR